jgi:hypothetical protein
MEVQQDQFDRLGQQGNGYPFGGSGEPGVEPFVNLTVEPSELHKGSVLTSTGTYAAIRKFPG